MTATIPRSRPPVSADREPLALDLMPIEFWLVQQGVDVDKYDDLAVHVEITRFVAYGRRKLTGREVIMGNVPDCERIERLCELPAGIASIHVPNLLDVPEQILVGTCEAIITLGIELAYVGRQINRVRAMLGRGVA